MWIGINLWDSGSGAVIPPVIPPVVPPVAGGYLPSLGYTQHAVLHAFERPDEYGSLFATLLGPAARIVELRGFTDQDMFGLLQATSIKIARIDVGALPDENILMFFLNDLV